MKNEKMFHLDLNGGPSFPAGVFASTTNTDVEAGFAKSGFNINLDFGYQISDYVGLTARGLYGNFSLDISAFNQTNVTADHWQYYGLVVGPMLTLPVADKAKVDVKAMGGIANANSPAVKLNGTIIADQDWSVAFAMQFGANLRYNFKDNLFGLVNADYSYMKPSFSIITGTNGSSVTTTEDQKMGAFNVGLGVGINF
jgi:Outer membrane protein beta-barrel domain